MLSLLKNNSVHLGYITSVYICVSALCSSSYFVPIAFGSGSIDMLLETGAVFHLIKEPEVF
jgi:hypothetical protein